MKQPTIFYLQNVIIGISGGISAYKTPELIRLFRKNNIKVKVVTTQNALKFVSELVIRTLSEDSVYYDVFTHTDEYNPEHISVADMADAMLIAPATANVIAKFANGIADDALTTTYISFSKQVFIAPAMNTKMWEHPATQKNIEVLKQHGVIFIGPETGELACGYKGIGRMAECEKIFSTVIDYYRVGKKLNNKNVLVTAGPTYEPIDPVRFIGNRSSGKMGFAIAEEFARHGAKVTLVSGPVNISFYNPNIKLININTAKEMLNACISVFPETDITVMAAAVADFEPAEIKNNKVKKQNKLFSIKLKPTTDILKTLSSMKKSKQIIVGFALETENEISNALEKLHNKNIDCIVMNSLRDENSGFGHNTNKITIITKNENINKPLKTKKEAARDIVKFISDKMM